MKRKFCIGIIFGALFLFAFRAFAAEPEFVGGIGNFEEEAAEVMRINIDPAKIKVTISDPPVGTEQSAAHSTYSTSSKQIIGNPFEGLKRTTLDEIIAKYNLDEKDVKSRTQFATRGAGSPAQVGGIPYISPSLSMSNAYDIKNKSIQTDMTAAGQIHWYVLNVSPMDANRDMSCILTNIPDGCDYDLYISANGIDFSGMPVSGNNTEEWVVAMPVGTYYVIVVSDIHPTTTNSCYTVYAGRRYWQKIMTIELPHEAWDVNGNLKDINPVWFGYELWSDGYYHMRPTEIEMTYNLNGFPYSQIPYGAVVHHHDLANSQNQEYSSKLWDLSQFRAMGGGSWGTLEGLGAYHYVRPTDSAHASSVTGMYRYSGDTKINEDTANLVNRSKVFPVRQEYVLAFGWDGYAPSTLWETYYTIGNQTIWIEFEANSVNVVHLKGAGAGIPCQSR